MTLVVMIVAFSGWYFMPPQLDMPDHMKQKYSRLYDQTVEVNTDGSRRFDKASLWNRHGIRVLHLKGDEFEMGFQHGRLLKEEMHGGTMQAVSEILVRQSKNVFGTDSLLPKLIDFANYKLIAERIFKSSFEGISKEDHELYMHSAWGISQGSGVAVKQLVKSAFGPESFQVLMGIFTEKYPGITAGATSASSCSAFAVWDEYSKTGDVVIGRNTDFPLTGFYDQNATVIYFEPDHGQKYMAVTSAGYHNAGVAGFNESGLYVGIHTMPTHEVSPSGAPAFMIGHQTVKRATNFEQALELLTKRTTAAGWSYFVVSTKEKKAATVEFSNKNVTVVHHQQPFHAQTNHYISEEKQDQYLHINATVDTDTLARKARLLELIEQNKGAVDSRVAMTFLADKYDTFRNTQTNMRNTVSTNFTVSSMVFDPGNQVMHVGNGLAPTSQNTYVRLPLVSVFDAKAFSSFDSKPTKVATFAGDFPDRARAEQLFIVAKNKYENDFDIEGAKKALDEVIALDPEDATYRWIHGMFALKLNQYQEARADFERSSALESEGHMNHLSQFFLARALAADGDSEGAKVVLTGLSGDQSVNIKMARAVQALLESPQPAGEIPVNKLAVVMHSGDVSEY